MSMNGRKRPVSLTQEDLEYLAANEKKNEVHYQQWLSMKGGDLQAKREQAQKEAEALKIFQREQALFKKAEKQLVREWALRKTVEKQATQLKDIEADTNWRIKQLKRELHDQQHLQKRREDSFTLPGAQEGPRVAGPKQSFLPPLKQHR